MHGLIGRGPDPAVEGIGLRGRGEYGDEPDQHHNTNHGSDGHVAAPAAARMARSRGPSRVAAVCVDGWGDTASSGRRRKPDAPMMSG